MNRAQYTIHLVPFVEWKRGSLSASRRRLYWLSEMEALLDTLERGAVRSIILGGSAVLIEDYLMFRPEAYDRIETLAAEGRLLIGPWYALPDSILAGGEALIRNLQIGLETAQLFGQPFKVGYLPGGSGHSAQLPQILRRFGIESALVTHGLGNEPPELIWSAPGGMSVALAYTQREFRSLEEFREALVPQSTGGHLLYFFSAYPLEARITRLMNEGGPDRVASSTLSAYLQGFSADLPRVAGQLRSPQRFPVAQGRLSAQMRLKQRSHAAEILLTRWMEPFAALESLLLPQTARRESAAMRLAWRRLLENQTTEILGGEATADALPDIEARFRESEQLADTLADMSLFGVSRFVDTASLSYEDYGAVVFNPSSTARTALIQYGDPLLTLIARDVPPLGYALCKADFAPEALESVEGDLVVENEFVRGKVDPAGPTLTLTDKVRGVDYPRLMILVSEGDQGDVRSYAPVGRGIHTARDLDVTLMESERTALYQRLKYTVRLSIDSTPEMAVLDVLHPVTYLLADIELLAVQGVPRLDVRVTIHNTLVDHRVRAHFALPFKAQTAHYDGTFEVRELPIEDLPPLYPPEGWAETPLGTLPQKAFVGVFDPLTPHNGLVIANRGLPEVEMLTNDMEQSEVALTLLRSVYMLHKAEGISTRDHERDDYTASSEDHSAALLGDNTAEFSLIPVAFGPGCFDEAWAYSEGPLRAEPVRRFRSGEAQPLPERGSLASVSDLRFRLTAAKLPEDAERGGFILRGFNYSAQEILVRLTPIRRFAQCEVCQLDESQTGGKLAVEASGAVEFYAAPGNLLTFWFHD